MKNNAAGSRSEQSLGWWIGTSYTKGGGMETVVGAIAIAFVLWWLAEEFQQFARRNRALEFVQWWRRRGANLLSLRELIGEDRRVIAQHRELHWPVGLTASREPAILENGVGDQSLPGSALEVIEAQLFFQLLVRLLAPGRNGVSEWAENAESAAAGTAPERAETPPSWAAIPSWSSLI
jgi:hypothetical protein